MLAAAFLTITTAAELSGGVTQCVRHGPVLDARIAA